VGPPSLSSLVKYGKCSCVCLVSLHPCEKPESFLRRPFPSFIREKSSFFFPARTLNFSEVGGARVPHNFISVTCQSWLFLFFSIFLRSWWSSFSSPAHLITYGKCNEIRTRMIITACVLAPHDRKHEGRPQIITKHPEKKGNKKWNEDYFARQMAANQREPWDPLLSNVELNSFIDMSFLFKSETNRARKK
jgi:hypothetical protein